MKHTFSKNAGKGILPVLTAVLLLLVPVFAINASADTYDEAGATEFEFSETAVKVTEGNYTGYKIEGTALTINGKGTYILSGTCGDGSVTVKKGTTGVTLILSGLTLSSEDTAVISCNKSTEVTIVAAEGTVNTLTDSEYNNDETHEENENAENAVIKCKDGSNVTIAGTGTLNVVSNGKNGIKSGSTTEAEGDASLTIKDLTLNITSNVNDAINAEQELNVLSGHLTIESVDDAVKSDLVVNIGEKGTDGPTIDIPKCAEGLEGATVNVYSGTITMYATDDGINAANADLTDYDFAINIYGGNITIKMASGDTDAIDSNGDLNIYGGTIDITASLAFDYDGKGTLDESAVVTVNGQRVTTLTQSMMGGMPGQMPGGRNGQWPGNFNGERPELPDGESFNGERPELPDGESFNGERPTPPDFNGERPSKDKVPETAETTEAAETTTESGGFFGWLKSIWDAIVRFFTGK